MGRGLTNEPNNLGRLAVTSGRPLSMWPLSIGFPGVGSGPADRPRYLEGDRGRRSVAPSMGIDDAVLPLLRLSEASGRAGVNAIRDQLHGDRLRGRSTFPRLVI